MGHCLEVNKTFMKVYEIETGEINTSEENLKYIDRIQIGVLKPFF